MVFDGVDVAVALAAECVAQIGCAYACLVPMVGEGGFYDTAAVEGVGCYAEESVDYSTACYADVVGEVAVCLVAFAVVVAYLSEVARRLAKKHLVGEVALQEAESLVGSSCLEIGQCHVCHFLVGYVVGALGHPVGC